MRLTDRMPFCCGEALCKRRSLGETTPGAIDEKAFPFVKKRKNQPAKKKKRLVPFYNYTLNTT